VVSNPRPIIGQRVAAPATVPFAFVPAAAASPDRAIRQVTSDMIASTSGGLFGTGNSPLAAPSHPSNIAFGIYI
jgi:hypothetical protein